ncbi:hypothetical protein QFZ30_003130 [Arthrobacter pascens]|uniref:hypothetical protein n=1 Tax=Arthrobacter pascens TaxID=1677 RepID=UPI002791D44F|nr:hypothetical protein [Arthrobacter pascens]MDQ0679748.1 hypothetical protein [Arthrobacter pascens]
MRIMPLRRAAGIALLAGVAVLLAPAPAHAEFICWMSDDIRYCYDDGQVPGAPDPVPVEEPPVDPAPVPDPVLVIERPVQPAPVQPVPVQPDQPATPQPATVQLAPAPVYPVPVQAYVPRQYGGHQAADVPPAAQPVAEVPAEAAPAEVPPSADAAAPVADTAAVPTISASPTAAVSPPSSASGTALVARGQATSTETLDALPLLLTLGGVLLTASLAWYVLPVRSALARLVGGRR